MKQYRKWTLAALFACLFFLCGCDSTSMKDVAISSPEVLSFSPESGSIGSDVIVTGEYLDDVVSATIGGGKVTILQKVSNQRLSLKVTDQARSGKIVLTNSIGEGVSEAELLSNIRHLLFRRPEYLRKLKWGIICCFLVVT